MGGGQPEGAVGEVKGLSAPARLTAIAGVSAALVLAFWGTALGLRLVAWLDGAWAEGVYRLVGACGAPVVAYEDGLYGPGFAVRVNGMCNGLWGWIVIGAVAAFWPVDWRRRLAGAAIGIAAMSVVNAFRLSSIYLLGIRWPGAGLFAHDIVWPVLHVLFGAAVLFAIARRRTP